MNPENMSAEALHLFNRLVPEGQRQAVELAESVGEEEAVYLTVLRAMSPSQRRRFLFGLSRRKWGL